MSKSATIAFGPETKRPSWFWVGADVAGELRKYFTVTTFRKLVPPADVIVVIKEPLSPEQLQTAMSNGSCVVYLPVDQVRDESHLRSMAPFLERCSFILSHSKSLIPHFNSFAPTELIDHHGKYFLPDILPYKSTGYVLWVGTLPNLPFLIHYLRSHPLPVEIKALTDVDNPGARRWARENASRLGIEFSLNNDHVQGIPLVKWSEEEQTRMMREARAAVDIKGDNFNQQNKPPTKAQQFICSGLPLAMNPCESTRYFDRNQLAIPVPDEQRWLSKAYHDAVCKTAARLRPTLTLEAVGKRLMRLIDEVLQG